MPTNPSLFGYQFQKLNEARRSLMAPHLEGEDRSFGQSKVCCTLAFNNFDVGMVKDEDARSWISTIQRLMNADAMTTDERIEFSSAVDKLASWFELQFWLSTEK